METWTLVGWIELVGNSEMTQWGRGYCFEDIHSYVCFRLGLSVYANGRTIYAA